MRGLLAALLALALVAVACGANDAGETTDSSTDSNTESTDPQNTFDAGGDELLDEELLSGGYVPPVDLSVTEIRVGYLEQWPTPNLLGRPDRSFDLVIGAQITWVPFGSSAAMSDAMERGQIDISYSQDVTSFAIAVNDGADFTLVGIAVAYSEGDNCVAQGSLGVTRENAAEVLDGARVMTTSGDAPNLRLVAMMDFLGVDVDSLTIVANNDGETTSAAFEAGDVDVGCAFGGPLAQMLDDFDGDLIMTGADLADIGSTGYGVVSIASSYGEDHRDAVVTFLGATQFFNEKWVEDPEGTAIIIAEASGLEAPGDFLGGSQWFSFPSLADQVSNEWMGDAVASTMAEHVQTLVDLGQIESFIEDFSGFVDTSFLEQSIAGE